MSDPRDTTQRHEARGVVDTGAHKTDVDADADVEQHNPADDMETAEKDAAEDGASELDDPNDLDADNAVEADSIQTLDPDNPPS